MLPFLDSKRSDDIIVYIGTSAADMSIHVEIFDMLATVLSDHCYSVDGQPIVIYI